MVNVEMIFDAILGIPTDMHILHLHTHGGTDREGGREGVRENIQ